MKCAQGVAAAAALVLAAMAGTTPAKAALFVFSTGTPNGQMAMASRPAGGGLIETEAADDFILTDQTSLMHATFYGLIPVGTAASNVAQVVVEFYRVFPNDSVNPPSGHVPTRVNSPSDVAIAVRDSAAPDLTFNTAIQSANFTANNSVRNGINPVPGQMTGGEGAVTGVELLIDVTFTTPVVLQPDHYFFVPQVRLLTGEFVWLSGQRPTVPPFSPDLQTWIRNAPLDPDWLRVGTDIVGGVTPPTFNGAFSLDGEVVPEPGSAVGLIVGAALLVRRREKFSV